MDRLSLFATPIFVIDLAPLVDVVELGRELGERLLREQAADAGVKRSNVGGWHSRPDLAQRPEPCFRVLFQTIVAHVGEIAGAKPGEPRYRYGVHAWAMIMRQGDYAMIHDHADAHWSSVYYVDAGEDGPPPSGALAFVDPRRSGRSAPGLDMSASTFHVKAKTGVLVIFPGWLQHYVHAYRGTRPRISISANLVLEPGAVSPAGA